MHRENAIEILDQKTDGNASNITIRKKLMSQDLRLPPAALSASGSRVEGLPSSQPVPQAPLLCNFFHYKAKQQLCQIKNLFTKLSKKFPVMIFPARY